MCAAQTIDVLVVDDSGFMRLALQRMLQSDPQMRVVGEATSGEEAVRMTALLRPHVITMDLEMPGMDGFEATRQIMSKCPTPIIVVSSLTTHGGVATFRALSTGAVDYVPKSSSFVDLDIVNIENNLLEKIRHWALHGPRTGLDRATERESSPWQERIADPALPPLAAPPRPVDLVVIGASTGGPRLLPELLALTGRLRCPIIVALHMPAVYTHSFAAHVAHTTGLTVVEGSHMLIPKAGEVIIAPGGTDTQVQFTLSGACRLKVGLASESDGIHPSVDVLLSSAAEVSKSPVGVILSGMGQDGVRGAQQLAARSHPVLVQDEHSSVVWGMPKAVIDAGAATAELNIEKIARAIKEWAGETAAPSSSSNSGGEH